MARGSHLWNFLCGKQKIGALRTARQQTASVLLINFNNQGLIFLTSTVAVSSKQFPWCKSHKGNNKKPIHCTWTDAAHICHTQHTCYFALVYRSLVKHEAKNSGKIYTKWLLPEKGEEMKLLLKNQRHEAGGKNEKCSTKRQFLVPKRWFLSCIQFSFYWYSFLRVNNLPL